MKKYLKGLIGYTGAFFGWCAWCNFYGFDKVKLIGMCVIIALYWISEFDI